MYNYNDNINETRWVSKFVITFVYTQVMVWGNTILKLWHMHPITTAQCMPIPHACILIKQWLYLVEVIKVFLK